MHVQSSEGNLIISHTDTINQLYFLQMKKKYLKTTTIEFDVIRDGNPVYLLYKHTEVTPFIR